MYSCYLLKNIKYLVDPNKTYFLTAILWHRLKYKDREKVLVIHGKQTVQLQFYVYSMHTLLNISIFFNPSQIHTLHTVNIHIHSE